MSHQEKEKMLARYRLNKTMKLLREEIDKIPDVQSWADKAGVSRRWLCKAMKKAYGNSPKVIIREVRYEIIKECVEDDPEVIGYTVATEAGLRDEKALFKFLSTHFDTRLTLLREEVLSEKQKD